MEINDKCSIDIPIKNIEKSEWFKTMDNYPKTITQIKTLIELTDKIGIFEMFDLKKISNMDHNRLNAIYAILRIMNKVYNGYVDYVVKKIFINQIKDLFIFSNVTVYDLFLIEIKLSSDISFNNKFTI